VEISETRIRPSRGGLEARGVLAYSGWIGHAGHEEGFAPSTQVPHSPQWITPPT